MVLSSRLVSIVLVNLDAILLIKNAARVEATPLPKTVTTPAPTPQTLVITTPPAPQTLVTTTPPVRMNNPKTWDDVG